jgi:hypothetical protein
MPATGERFGLARTSGSTARRSDQSAEAAASYLRFSAISSRLDLAMAA